MSDGRTQKCTDKMETGIRISADADFQILHELETGAQFSVDACYFVSI